MRPTAIFFGYLLLCLLLATALTEPLLAAGWFEVAPRRAMGRLAQIFMLLGCWPLLRLLALDQRHLLGYGVPARMLAATAGFGWLAGVAMLVPVLMLLVLLEVRTWQPLPLRAWFEILPGALFAGLLIALIEETFFRGALFAAIRRQAGPLSAATWSALLYALVHFLRPHDLPPGVQFDAAGAWWMFIGVFTGALRWEHLDAFVALFLASILLGLVRARTGHLGWCIGLHAGWVFTIQAGRRLTAGVTDARWGWLASHYDGVIGWLALAPLATLTLFVWLALRGQPTTGGSEARDL